jgi:BirA family biotin operon repressor/biotin-[acetyl-CoA-carboxylase] ligase
LEEIVMVHSLGYREDGTEPSDLSAETIAAALTTHRLGHPVLFFARIGSTNDVVHEYAAGGAPEGMLVVADEQTAGRGRLNRSWWAAPGSSLLMSLLLRPPIPLSQAGRLTMCLGLGAIEGIEEVTGLRPDLKWPNDILLNSRKLGGILAELRTSDDRLDYAVLGLGLNVNLEWDKDRRTNDEPPRQTFPCPNAGTFATSLSSKPSEMATPATSLLVALGRPVERLRLLAGVLARCEVWYERLLAAAAEVASAEPRDALACLWHAPVPAPKVQAGRASGDELLLQAWTARLDTLGRAVLVSTPAGELRGVAVGVNSEGALLVRDTDGHIHAIWSGDVRAVRADPAD